MTQTSSGSSGQPSRAMSPARGIPPVSGKQSREARRNVKNRIDMVVQDEVNATAAETRAGTDGDFSATTMQQFLDIPLLETLSRINAQVGGLQKQLSRVDVQVSAALNPPADGDTSIQPSTEQPDSAAGAGITDTFITAVDATEEKDKKKVAIDVGSVRVRSIESVAFPGVESQPSELPGNMHAHDVIKRLAGRWQFPSARDQGVWEQNLASPQSQALMKDLFWWFYAEKFSNGGHAAEQEKLFSRMAANFVRLLTKVPQTHKDKFFDRFYHILALSVFVAFKVSLVESDAAFDGAFLAELSRLFAYWTTGGDIGPNNYVLPNGKDVSVDHGVESVQAVVSAMRAEQEELDQMVADRKTRRHSPTATPHRGPIDGTPSNGKHSSSSRGPGPGTARRRTGSPSGPARAPGTSRKSPGKSSMNGPGTPSTAGHADWRGALPESNMSPAPRTGTGRPATKTARASSKEAPGPEEGLPVIPPLRLPVKRDTALRTPRVIWTAKSSRTDGPATARSAATTARPTPRRAHTARELTGILPGPRARRLSGASSAGSGASAQAHGETPVSHRVPRPPKHPRGATSDPPPVSAGRPGGQGWGGAGGREEEDVAGKKLFDVKGTSPFLRYFLLTQVSTALVARPTWKQITSDETVKAWGRRPRTELAPVRSKRGAEAEEEEAEEEVQQAREDARLQLLQTPREASRQAMKRNSRLVSEYYRRSQTRTKLIGETRRTTQKVNEAQRSVMKTLLHSQEQSHVFSNLLVSSGGGVAFDSVWRKQLADKQAQSQAT